MAGRTTKKKAARKKATKKKAARKKTTRKKAAASAKPKLPDDAPSELPEHDPLYACLGFGGLPETTAARNLRSHWPDVQGAKKLAFLACRSFTPSDTEAARTAKVGLSTVYRYRHEDEAFAAACEVASALATQWIMDVAVARVERGDKLAFSKMFDHWSKVQLARLQAQLRVRVTEDGEQETGVLIELPGGSELRIPGRSEEVA